MQIDILLSFNLAFTIVILSLKHKIGGYLKHEIFILYLQKKGWHWSQNETKFSNNKNKNTPLGYEPKAHKTNLPRLEPGDYLPLLMKCKNNYIFFKIFENFIQLKLK